MKHKIFVGIAVLAAVTLVSGASILAMAAPATNTDPLVTLSYLNGPFKTLIQSDITAALKAINDRLTAAEDKLSNDGGPQASANVFTVRNLAAGKSLTIEAGSELMAESGTITYSGNLTRISGTPESSSSGTLSLYNMYIATGKVTLTVSSASKLWVRTAPGLAQAVDTASDVTPPPTADPEPDTASNPVPDPADEPTPNPADEPVPDSTPEPTPAPPSASTPEPVPDSE